MKILDDVLSCLLLKYFEVSSSSTLLKWNISLLWVKPHQDMIFSQNMICRESTFCGVYLLHISDDVGAIQNYSPFSLTNKTVGITFDPPPPSLSLVMITVKLIWLLA